MFLLPLDPFYIYRLESDLDEVHCNLLCLYCSHECEKCRASEQDSAQGIALPLNLIVDKVKPLNVDDLNHHIYLRDCVYTDNNIQLQPSEEVNIQNCQSH